MKKRNQHRLPYRKFQPARLATAATASAVSLTLLAAAQNPLQAQTPKQAPATAQKNAKATDDEAWDKYFDFGYNYCDAKVLAAFWGEDSPGDAKIAMGHKLLAAGPETGEWAMREARSEGLKKVFPNMPCDYTDAGYTYEDAELLGKYWGGGTWESKVTMTKLLVGGHDKVIKAAVKSAKADQ